MALALDGSNNVTANATHQNNVSCLLSTSGTTDVLIAILQNAGFGGQHSTSLSSITDNSGVTAGWTRRAHNTVFPNGNDAGQFEFFWTTASGALTGANVTAQLAGSNTCECMALTVFAISGACTATPFDPYRNLPINYGATSGITYNISNNFSTAAQNTFAIGYVAFSTVNNAPSQYTNIAFPNATGPNESINSWVGYQILSAPANTEYVVANGTPGAGALALMYLDAVVDIASTYVNPPLIDLVYASAGKAGGFSTASYLNLNTASASNTWTTGTYSGQASTNNEVMVVLLAYESNANTSPRTVSVTESSGSLVFTLAANVEMFNATGSTNSDGWIEVWTAPVSNVYNNTGGAQTFSVSWAAGGTSYIDGAALISFMVSNCYSIVAPFDSNASIPSTNNIANVASSNNPMPITGTLNQHGDLLVSMVSQFSGQTASSNGANGWFNLCANSENAGHAFLSMGSYFNYVQNTGSFTYQDSAANNQHWAGVMLAFKSQPPTVQYTKTLLFLVQSIEKFLAIPSTARPVISHSITAKVPTDKKQVGKNETFKTGASGLYKPKNVPYLPIMNANTAQQIQYKVLKNKIGPPS